MKNKKLIIICSLGIIVLLSILIGTGILTFNFYKGEMSNSIHSSWNNTKSIGRLNTSNEKIFFPKIPVIVVYKNSIFGDIDAANPIKIDISEKDLGTLWFPFFKKSEYNFSINCNDVYEIKTDKAIGQFMVNGNITVSGRYKYIGSYSTETATRLVVNKVLSDIYNEVNKNLK